MSEHLLILDERNITHLFTIVITMDGTAGEVIFA